MGEGETPRGGDDRELAFAGIARQAELIRAGEVSARELTELYLARIDRFGGELNCFTTVLGERALAEADQADARRAAGEDLAIEAVDETGSTNRVLMEAPFGREPAGPRLLAAICGENPVDD